MAELVPSIYPPIASDVTPAIDDTYWLGGDTLGWKGIKFPDLKLYQVDADTLSLENIAGGTYKDFRGGFNAPDDIVIAVGTGKTVSILYETADANANALIVVAPEGGGTDVPAFIFGDASILNVDLGWFNGLTEPSLVVVNDAGDAYIRIDAGDDAVAGSQGIYFKAAADEDIELINLSVTGTPRIYWDEDLDSLRSTKPIILDAGILFIGDTANAQMTTGITINIGAAGNEAFSIKNDSTAHGITGVAETDTIGFMSRAQVNGGLVFKGITDADGSAGIALDFWGVLGKAADTTKTSAGLGIIRILAAIKSGVNPGAAAANSNLVTIEGYDNVKFIFDQDGDLWMQGGITLGSAGTIIVGSTQVVGTRVIDARCDDVVNSGDVTTDGVIDALRDAMIAHGLIAAA